MAVVYIPAQLREHTGGLRTVEAAGTSVREIVEALETRFPGIAARLCDGNELQAGLQVSIDDAISTRGLLARVDTDSEVHFLPAIGGG